MRSRYIAGLIVAIFTGSLATQAPAYGGVINGHFETGDLSGWSVVGTASVVTAAFGVTPPNGSFQALIQSQSASFTGVPVDILEASLGLPPGGLDLVTGPEIQGSAIYQTVQVKAGETLKFRWNFLTREEPHAGFFNDFAFFAIIPAAGPGDAFKLADTDSPLVPSNTPFNWETTYQDGAWNPGTYRIAFGVIDVFDDGIRSGLLIDAVSASAVPEPTSLALVMVGGLLMAPFCSRRKRGLNL